MIVRQRKEKTGGERRNLCAALLPGYGLRRRVLIWPGLAVSVPGVILFQKEDFPDFFQILFSEFIVRVDDQQMDALVFRLKEFPVGKTFFNDMMHAITPQFNDVLAVVYFMAREF